MTERARPLTSDEEREIRSGLADLGESRCDCVECKVIWKVATERAMASLDAERAVSEAAALVVCAEEDTDGGCLMCNGIILVDGVEVDPESAYCGEDCAMYDLRAALKALSGRKARS